MREGTESGVEISRGMIGWVKRVPKESIIEIKAKAVIPQDPITGPTQKEVELQVQEFWIIRKSAPTLPGQSLRFLTQTGRRRGQNDHGHPAFGSGR